MDAIAKHATGAAFYVIQAHYQMPETALNAAEKVESPFAAIGHDRDCLDAIVRHNNLTVTRVVKADPETGKCADITAQILPLVDAEYCVRIFETDLKASRPGRARRSFSSYAGSGA